jgi:EAL and modified HD-GYP domain-containing signal transduction protein
MKVYSARQPVLNAKLQIVAYELKFRDCNTNEFPTHVAPETATAKLLVNSYLTSGFESITEGKPAFIDFPNQLLADHLLHMVPYKNIIMQMSQADEPNDENYALVRKLFHKRYVLALDDFSYTTEWKRFLPLIKLVKIDLQKHSLRAIATLLPMFRQFKIRVLADNVSSYAQFNQAKQLGFSFFKGDFLFTPEVVEANEIETNQLFLLSIYAEVMKQDFDYKILEGYFEKDMGLTYKLLRFVNSSLFDIKREITSLKQAMIFLGETQLRKFICLIVTSQLNPNKPKALVQETVIRARLCELMASEMGLGSDADSAFLTGLFSTIDAILDKPMEVVLKSLPLAEPIKKAILGNQGKLAECLNTSIAYLQGDWMVVFAFAKTYNVQSDYLISSCDNAYDWMGAFQQISDKQE